jgi:REP element-mobilizing transposase RayT
MSRLRRIEQRERHFFVTTNLDPRIAPLSPAERTHVLQILDNARLRMGFFLFAFVVMPTHSHLLMWPQRSDLTAIMREFKSKSGLALSRRRNIPGPFWQPRFFDFVCRCVKDFHAKIEYIRQNPVTAGLAASPEEWRWSSAASRPPIHVDQANLPADGNALLWPGPWR